MVTVNQLPALGMMFVVLGVTLGVGIYTISQVGVTGGFTQAADRYSNNSLDNATKGLQKIANWLPIIAIVLAAGIVIATLVGAFAFR